MPDAPTVAELRPGQELDAVLACTRKDRLTAKSGTPYLALTLRDATGEVEGRVFREADLWAGRFERGDLVRVSGRVERFRDALSVDLRRVARAEGEEADPERFLPVTRRDRDELDGFLEHLSGEVTDRGFRALLDALLGDPALRADLRRAPCSRAGHHAYLGGLLEHTVAVGQLCAEICTQHPRLEQDLLLTAALVHDLGRTREFTYGAELGLTADGALLGHIQLGLRLLDERAPSSLDPTRRTALWHCVLTHHGPDAVPGRRFGSPEAVALFRANALDAATKGALERGMGMS